MQREYRPFKPSLYFTEISTALVKEYIHPLPPAGTSRLSDIDPEAVSLILAIKGHYIC